MGWFMIEHPSQTHSSEGGGMAGFIAFLPTSRRLGPFPRCCDYRAVPTHTTPGSLSSDVAILQVPSPPACSQRRIATDSASCLVLLVVRPTAGLPHERAGHSLTAIATQTLVAPGLPPTKLGHMYFPTSRYIASALLSRPQRRWSRCQMPKTNPFDHCVSHKRQTHTSQD